MHCKNCLFEFDSCGSAGLPFTVAIKKKFAKRLYFSVQTWYNYGCSPTKVSTVHSSFGVT